RTVVTLSLFVFAACASVPPPPTAVIPALPPAAVAPAPAPAPPPTPSANAMTPVASVAKTIAAPRIRVGIVSDQATVTFPRLPGGYYIVSDTSSATIRRGFTLTAPVSDAPAHYAVQVSTIVDIASANALAEKLRAETRQRVNSVYDTAGTAYRVIAGDFPTSNDAQPLRDQLTEGGYGTNLPIVKRPSDQPFNKRHELVDDEGEHSTIHGESVLIMPVSAETLTIADKPYRTAARVFINSRGTYNVINELNVEDYLRGVVPAEMGPRIYDEIEALKAQAIAARTYAVRNLGQYKYEGYDICAGPACQAYNGASGEDALTDRAVRETAGLVATYNGQPIDALYTAACGGETSDVGTMFPGRSEPYLKRVRCVEDQVLTIIGHEDSGILTEQQVNARLFAAVAGLPDAGTSWSAREVQQAVTAAMQKLRFDPRSTVAPASSRRGDVLAYLAATLDLDRYSAVVTMPEDRTYYFPRTAAKETTPYRAAAFLIKFGFLPAEGIDRLDMNAAMPRDELYGLLYSWLRKHGVSSDATGRIVTLAGSGVTLKIDGKLTRFTLPANVRVFRKIGDRYQEYRSAPVTIGDRATITSDAGKTPVALVINAYLDGASFDRSSSFASWTRSFRADDLVVSINKRNPIRQLQGIRPLTIDASQRIAELEVTAENGRTFVLRGLPVRWSLNLPDNLFVYEKTQDTDGMDRYTFYGKGFGHGVGFCQVGAYGMATRGWTAQQILTHYYKGIEIEPMK
ncbi:MAG TPA: SpoIID/LytB domain-containing protein, partial [Thermoanaerobaculia bacterium]|nr:SpoIID/LytB domain-containing protein [Thermoanaerobaculia bacterium]